MAPKRDSNRKRPSKPKPKPKQNDTTTTPTTLNQTKPALNVVEVSIQQLITSYQHKIRSKNTAKSSTESNLDISKALNKIRPCFKEWIEIKYFVDESIRRPRSMISEDYRLGHYQQYLERCNVLTKMLDQFSEVAKDNSHFQSFRMWLLERVGVLKMNIEHLRGNSH